MERQVKIIGSRFPRFDEERGAEGEEGFMLKKDSENKVTDQLIVLRVGLVYLQLGWRRENSTLSSRV